MKTPTVKFPKVEKADSLAQLSAAIDALIARAVNQPLAPDAPEIRAVRDALAELRKSED